MQIYITDKRLILTKILKLLAHKSRSHQLLFTKQSEKTKYLHISCLFDDLLTSLINELINQAINQSNNIINECQSLLII